MVPKILAAGTLEAPVDIYNGGGPQGVAIKIDGDNRNVGLSGALGFNCRVAVLFGGAVGTRPVIGANLTVQVVKDTGATGTLYLNDSILVPDNLKASGTKQVQLLSSRFYVPAGVNIAVYVLSDAAADTGVTIGASVLLEDDPVTDGDGRPDIGLILGTAVSLTNGDLDVNVAQVIGTAPSLTNGDIDTNVFSVGGETPLANGTFVLDPTGLDGISIVEPSGDPSTWDWREWQMWLLMRFANRSAKTGNSIDVYNSASSKITTQAITEGATETIARVVQAT